MTTYKQRMEATKYNLDEKNNKPANWQRFEIQLWLDEEKPYFIVHTSPHKRSKLDYYGNKYSFKELMKHLSQEVKFLIKTAKDPYADYPDE